MGSRMENLRTMIKPLLALLIFSILTTTAVGQRDADIDFGVDMLKRAAGSFCEGDTNQTIRTLETFIATFPDLGTSLLIRRRLSDLYLAKGNTEQASDLLKTVLSTKPTMGYLLYVDSCGLYGKLDVSPNRAECCVTLSKTYDQLGDTATALEYLNLADTKYLPYTSCGNGMRMYRTKLSLDFADHYLHAGDTSKAIDRLIQYFILNEGYNDTVTAMLRSILLLSYSQQQITAEVKNALKTMKIVRGRKNEPEDILLITFFGRTVKQAAYKNLKFYKDIYRKDRNILFLMNG